MREVPRVLVMDERNEERAPRVRKTLKAIFKERDCPGIRVNSKAFNRIDWPLDVELGNADHLVLVSGKGELDLNRLKTTLNNLCVIHEVPVHRLTKEELESRLREVAEEILKRSRETRDSVNP